MRGILAFPPSIKLYGKTFRLPLNYFSPIYRAPLFLFSKTKLEYSIETTMSQFKFLFEDKACFRANLDYSWSNLMVSKVLYLHYLAKLSANENRWELPSSCYSTFLTLKFVCSSNRKLPIDLRPPKSISISISRKLLKIRGWPIFNSRHK